MKIILKLLKQRVRIESEKKSQFRLHFRNVYIHLSKVKQEVNSMYVSMHVETGIEKKNAVHLLVFMTSPNQNSFRQDGMESDRFSSFLASAA